MSRAGFLKALDAALAAFGDAGRAGWLIATNGRVQKRIAFEGGAAVFAVSNDPKDLMGQALLRAGLISEADLAQALAMPRTAGESAPHLFTALVAMKKVTPEQTKVVFEQKLRESVLALFLWTAGSIETSEDAPDSGSVFPTRIPVDYLLAEGPKRRARWQVVQRTIPSFDVAFERAKDWPAGFPATPGDKALAKRLEAGQTLAQILLELHGQDYAIGVRVTNLVQQGILRQRKPAGFAGVEIEVEVPIDVVEPPLGVVPRQVSGIPTGEFTKIGGEVLPNESIPEAFSPDLAAALLERANQLISQRQFEEALAVLTELVQNDPFAAGEAWTLMNVVEEGIVAAAEKSGLAKDAMLALARPLASFSGTVFPPDQTFVLSRFAAGRLSVAELLALCPFPPVELYRILRAFLDANIIRRAF